MLDSKAVVKETLYHLRTKFTMEQLMENLFADRIPITNHQARQMEALCDQTIDRGGFYTMAQLHENIGTAFCFYNAKGEVVKSIILKQPNIADDRKIPKRAWLEDQFSHIGYHNQRLEVKFLESLLESHIRDGGSWSSSKDENTIYFVLRMNEHVKARFEFHREDLSQ